MKRTYVSGLAALGIAIAGLAYTPATQTVIAADGGNCANVPTTQQLREAFGVVAEMADDAPSAVGGTVGGLFNGARMWAAVVNRAGQVCAYTTSTEDETQVWPGSQAIAKAKAYTGNAFSLDTLALSTAMLYTLTQPGHSLWSLGQSNLFNSDLLVAPGGRGDKNQIAGGLIFFGGGVPIYTAGGEIVGGLGISGDTSCADHEIAKRLRHAAGLNPPGGPTADDITYAMTLPTASVFAHPTCPNTWKNGVFVGNETGAFYP
jgi:uncharacterized protein GlcG (DUF336 family)